MKGRWVFVTAEAAAGVAGFVTLAGVVALATWLPWWVTVLLLAAPVGAVARLSRDARRLGLGYLAWRTGVLSGWEATSEAKRMTSDIGGEAEEKKGRRREGPKVLSGFGRIRRRSPALNRADTEDSEDRKRPAERSETDRFWENVDKTDGCWLWTGSLTDDGYPRFKVKRDSEWVWVKAHRWAWEQDHGPLSPGETLDHVRERGCEHRHCVRTAHLEPVTRAENARRAAAWRKRHPKDTPKDTVPGGTT